MSTIRIHTIKDNVRKSTQNVPFTATDVNNGIRVGKLGKGLTNNGLSATKSSGNAISSNDLYGENSNHGNFGPRVMVGCGRIVIVGKTINGRSPLFFATMDGFIYKKIDRSSFYVYHPCTVAGGKLYNLAGSSGSERVNVFDMNGNGLFTIEHSEIVNTDGNSYSGVLDKIKGFGNTLLLGTPLDDVDFSNSGSAWMVRVKTDADNIWETILEKIY